MSSKRENDNEPVPLCVDLDGTLIKTDLLIESFFALCKQGLVIFMAPFWLWKGKAHFKQKIADRVDLDVSVLPYHEAFLAFLKEQHAKGRRLILATASNEKYAFQVADYLGIFDEVIGSDAVINLSGRRKLERLEKACGNKGFDYAGDAPVDLKIWPQAQRAILVNPSKGVKRRAAKVSQIGQVFEEQSGGIKVYIKATRLFHWLKNLLIFVPLMAAHKFTDASLALQAFSAFLAFGLCASSVYLLNDLADLNADRHHPQKRRRPFAAGTLSLARGGGLIPILLIAAFALAVSLATKFLIVLGGYYIVTLAYSFWLKRKAILDVLALAGLYTIRIIAGGVAVGVSLSFWLLAFSIFIFFSLALVKRYTELFELQELDQEAPKGRGYQVSDLGILNSMGIGSGFIAVLILALYINSQEIEAMYSRPEIIWLLCPLLLYWISRIWLLVQRGEMNADPVIFAAKDNVSRLVGVSAVAILLIAI
jgi:4-hydroxybenzoate polyprenyltransferase